MAELTLKLRDIDEVGKDHSFQLSPEWMLRELADGLVRSAHSPGSLEVHVQLNGDEVLINGQVRAELVIECCRCLGEMACIVDTDLIALLSPAADDRRRGDKADEVELSEEDTYRAHYTGSEIVLDELVREHLILEVPMQPVCGPLCPGIPVPDHVRPPPGVFDAPTVDPRLAPLMNFKDKVPPKKE